MFLLLGLTVLLGRPAGAAKSLAFLSEASLPPHPMVFQAIQMLQLTAETGYTDGLKEEMTELLNIITKMQDEIVHAHNRTQVHIDSLVQELQEATATARDAKWTAVVEDNHWVDCMEDEQDLKRIADMCHDYTEAKSNNATNATRMCRLALDIQLVNASFHSTGYQCDFSMGGQCNTSFDQFKHSVEHWRNNLRTQRQTQLADFQEATEKCLAAKRFHEHNCSEDTYEADAWAMQRVTCGRIENKARMCDFATAYKSKCDVLAEYEHAIGQVHGNATNLSHSDRAHEFDMTELVSCLISTFDTKGNLESADVNFCQTSGRNLTTVIVPLDLHSERVAELTSGANFTCQEASFIFSGSTWTVPEFVTDYTQYVRNGDYSVTSNLSQPHVFPICPPVQACEADTPIINGMTACVGNMLSGWEATGFSSSNSMCTTGSQGPTWMSLCGNDSCRISSTMHGKGVLTLQVDLSEGSAQFWKNDTMLQEASGAGTLMAVNEIYGEGDVLAMSVPAGGVFTLQSLAVDSCIFDLQM